MCDMRDVCKLTMTTCKQYRPVLGEDWRLSKHEIYGAFWERFHFYKYLYNTYISWPSFNVKCSILRPQNVCKLLLAGVHNRFFSIHCGKKQWSEFLFQTHESIFTLPSTRWETGYGETVKNYRQTNPCFLLKTFKASRCRNVFYDSVKIVTLWLLCQARRNIICSFRGYWEHFNDILVSQCLFALLCIVMRLISDVHFSHNWAPKLTFNS